MSALVAFVFVAYGGSQSPSEVAQNYIKEYYDEKIKTNAEKIINLHDSDTKNDFNKVELEKDIDNSKKETKDRGGIKDIIIDKEEISEDKKVAKVYATMIYGNDSKAGFEFFINKENDEYVIFSATRILTAEETKLWFENNYMKKLKGNPVKN